MVPWRYDWNKLYDNLTEASEDFGFSVQPGWNNKDTDTLYAHVDVFQNKVEVYVWNRPGVQEEMQRFAANQSSV